MGCQLITLLALKISSASCLYRLLRYQQAHSDIVWHRTLNAMIETVSNTNNNRLIGFVSNYRYISNILTSKLLNNMNNMIFVFFCFFAEEDAFELHTVEFGNVGCLHRRFRCAHVSGCGGGPRVALR